MFYDKERTYMSYITLNTSSNGDNTMTTINAIVPYNAVYATINYRLPSGANAPSSITLDVVDGSHLLSCNNRALQDKSILQVHQNYYLKEDGTESDYNGFMYVTIPNCLAKKVFINGTMSHLLYILKHDGTVVDPSTLTQETIYRGTLFTLPSNIALLGVNMYVENGYMNLIYNDFEDYAQRDVAYATPISRLMNFDITVIGDSITYLDGRDDAETETAHIPGWQSYLRLLGANVTSYGYSGAPYTQNSETINIADKIVDDVQPDLSNARAVVLFGGSNDVRLSTPIGDQNISYGTADTNSATFVGAIGKLISYIRSQRSTAEIFLCTILPSASSTRGYNKTKQYNDALRVLAEFWNVPLIDLHTLCNIHPNQNSSAFYLDNVHPNVTGMRRIGRIVSAYIENYMSVVR